MEFLKNNISNIIAFLAVIISILSFIYKTKSTVTKRDYFRNELRSSIRDLKSKILEIDINNYKNNEEKLFFINIIHDKLYYNIDTNRKKKFLTKKENKGIVDLTEYVEDKFGEMTDNSIIIKKENGNMDKTLKLKQDIKQRIDSFLKIF